MNASPHRLRWPVTVLVMAIMLLSKPVVAGDVFTVRGVGVDARAAAATEARSIAIAQGQREAFDRLMRRITQNEDWLRLPDVASLDMQSLVRSFEVRNEKSSSTRYIATLAVSFRAEAVRELFRTEGIPISEAQAKPVLLLPILETPQARIFWEEPNPWRNALAAQDLGNILTPLVLPLGDIEDFSELTAQQVMAGDQAAILRLATRYGADSALVAVATADSESTRIDIWTRGYGSPPFEPITTAYRGEGDLADLTMRAARDLVTRLPASWKRGTLIRFGEEGSMNVIVRFGSQSEWNAIRQELEGLSSVQGVALKALTYDGAMIDIDFLGTPEQLGLSLAQRNLDLRLAEEGWQLSRLR